MGGQEAYLIPMEPTVQADVQPGQQYAHWPAHAQQQTTQSQQQTNPLPQFAAPAVSAIFRPRPQQPNRNEKRKKNRPAMEDGNSDDDEQCEHTAKRLASELSRFHLNK